MHSTQASMVRHCVIQVIQVTLHYQQLHYRSYFYFTYKNRLNKLSPAKNYNCSLIGNTSSLRLRYLSQLNSIYTKGMARLGGLVCRRQLQALRGPVLLADFESVYIPINLAVLQKCERIHNFLYDHELIVLVMCPLLNTDIIALCRIKFRI